MINGASTVPLFIPLVPQVFFIIYAASYFKLSILRLNLAKYYFVLVSIFFLALILASVLRLDSDLILRYEKLFLNSIFSAVVATALISKYGRNFSSIYTKYITAFALLGITGLLLIEISEWNIVASIGERAYHTNFLTVWIFDDGYNSSLTRFSPLKYRLQSFFDEPGTFGILLIPALFQSMQTRQIKTFLILAVSIFLTESANAWIMALFIFIFQIFIFNSIPKKIFFMALLSLFILLFSVQLVNLYEIKTGIDEAYSNSSSLGTRTGEYSYALNNIFNHIIPFENKNLVNFNLSGISSSYVEWFVSAGWFFFLVLIAGLALTLSLLFIAPLEDGKRNYFPFVLALSLFLSGFHRTSVFDNVMFMSLFYWALSVLYFYRRKTLLI